METATFGAPLFLCLVSLLILKGVCQMDDKIAALKAEIESFMADVAAQIEAAKQTSQAAINAAVAKAVADVKAGNDADLDALADEVKKAHDAIKVPPFQPSNN